jgi:hypothetical protein
MRQSAIAQAILAFVLCALVATAQKARQQADTFRGKLKTARQQAESFRVQAEILRGPLAKATKQVGALRKAKTTLSKILGRHC